MYSPSVGGCGYSLQANIKRYIIAIKHGFNYIVSTDVGKPIGVDMFVVLTKAALKRGTAGNNTVADAIRIIFRPLDYLIFKRVHGSAFRCGC